MTFTNICVGFVIIIGILVATMLVSISMNLFDGDDTTCFAFAWLFSSIGFGICLTILLYQNGIVG